MTKQEKEDGIHDPEGALKVAVPHPTVNGVPEVATEDPDSPETEPRAALEGLRRSLRKVQMTYAKGALLLGVTLGLVWIGLAAKHRNRRRRW